MALARRLDRGGVVGVYARPSLGDHRGLRPMREGKLALWQVIARAIDQGCSLSRGALSGHSCGLRDTWKVEPFHEEHSYANLDWLQAHQGAIEKKLFHPAPSGQPPELFLYYVTSNYLEGEKNQLAAFLIRDGKKGKRQIVIGLLCDDQGTALSIEVFQGNTADTQTFSHQVTKVAQRFGGGAADFVGYGG